MGRRTPLYELHRTQGARMVEFAGWEMPLHYGSQIEEHHAVRRTAGMFDVSHMGVIDVRGQKARAFLRYLLANDVARLGRPGRALYSCMLNESAGILDDLIVYFLGPESAGSEAFRIVVNAGTREKDLAWIRERAQTFEVEVTERDELAMIAVQGPQARERLAALLAPEDAQTALSLSPFSAAAFGEWFVARTGYTGEDGFEVMLPASDVLRVWRELAERGVSRCGLGARDTLRLEAGMNLYGSDMDENTHPLECGLEWTVAFEPADRSFVGREALEAIRARGSARRRVGLLLEERGVLRSHQKVIVPGVGEGEITSGTFSPTLQRSIALARVPAAQFDRVQVDVRGKLLPARVVEPPFVRRGKVLVG
jgi:glycine cleavage system T protein|nr:MAG: glycine cleavage system aminomethyltransferase GcvT [Pseudomonadota bacterium]